MEKEFVPYELALKLKELGFREKCFGYWNKGELMSFKQEPNSSFYAINIKHSVRISAPLWQQAFDWFKVNKNLYADIYRTDKVFSANIEDILMGNSLCGVIKEVSYEEARQASLIKLIELCKNLKL